MTKSYLIEADGSLTVTEAGAQLQQFDALTKTFVGVTDKTGAPVLSESRVNIQRDQIPAHRRDAAFDAALPADVRAVLDAPVVLAAPADVKA